MAGFLAGLSVGAVIGAAATEILKQLGGSILKRRHERSTERRKLIRSDLEGIEKRVEPLVKLAHQYYSKPSTQGVEDARQIKAELKAFAIRWNAVCALMRDAGMEDLSVVPLISFRQALTREIDTVRADGLTAGHGLMEAVTSGGMATLSAVIKARYSSL